MANNNSGYPLFGAPFNEVTDYGFNNDSLITSFVKDKQKPSIHEGYDWKCNKAYCLYNNKDTKHNGSKMKCQDYVQSNPIDIINTTRSDFICHSSGPNQNLLRICQWNDNQINNDQFGKLKQGKTFDLSQQIEGISHCNDYFNHQTMILTWNRYQAVYLGMKHIENNDDEYTFDIAREFEPTSNTTFKSGILCPLPYVFNSGLEDSAFFASDGKLMLYKNKANGHSIIDLKYQEIPPWSEIMWTEHPRVIRFSCDVELLTIDLRVNIKQKSFKCAQKHIYFDPITAINSDQHYITTAGFQGLALYDDRMLKRPLSKWKFYDFDYSMGDGVFSRLQIYPLQNNDNSEYWIICSGRGQRVLIYPFFAKPDSPIKSIMPININKYIECFGSDTQINSVLACKHKDDHHIIATSEYGSMLCTQFKLKPHEKYDAERYNIWNDNMFNNKDINDQVDLKQLRYSLKGKREIKANVIYNKWSKQIEDCLLNDTKYSNLTDQSKIRHLAKELEQYSNHILQFTATPKTIEEIRTYFQDKLTDMKDLTLFDYFNVFKVSDIGLHTFQIESVNNIDSINEDGVDGNALNVIITYFTSRKLDEKDYILIEDPIIDRNIKDEEEEKQEIMNETTRMEETETNEGKKDELNLSEFDELIEIAATQEDEPYQEQEQYKQTQSTFDSFPIYNDISGHSTQQLLGDDNDLSINDDRLFKTNNDITDKCQNLLDSLCNKWMNGEIKYVVGDWSHTNEINPGYNGMIERRGRTPKRLRRGPKRVW